MGMTAPSEEAQSETARRLAVAHTAAKPFTDDQLAAVEADWVRDGIRHHMGATNIIHRLLATISSRRK